MAGTTRRPGQATDWTARLLNTAAAVLFVAAVVVGSGFLGPAPVPGNAPLPPASPTSAAPAVPARPPPRGVPSTVSIPAIDQLAVPVVPATVEREVLAPPADVRVAGIWTGGATLDASAGTTLLVGHVNYAGQGVGAFYDLASVAPGSAINTSGDTGAVTAWTVTAVDAMAKHAGVDPAAFAGPAGERRLVLVTCGGRFDARTGSYESNVYLWAAPAG